MQKQIDEVMGLVDSLAEDCIAAGIAQMAGSESARKQIAVDVRKGRADVESKLRELLQMRDGYAIVPITPTMPMLKEARRVDGYHGSMNEWLQDEGRDFIAMYRAAIRAVKKVEK